MKEYKNILINLNNYKIFKKKINKKDVIQYYFMRHIYLDKNWLIEDLSKMIKLVGGYDNQWSHHFYDYWVNNFNKNKHEKIKKSVEKFIKSKDNYFSLSHKIKN